MRTRAKSTAKILVQQERTKSNQLQFSVLLFASIVITFALKFLIGTLADYVMFALFITYLFYIYVTSYKSLIKYLYFIVFAIYHLLSVLTVNAQQTYLYNIQVYSYDNGSFFPLLLYYCLEFSVIFYLDRKKDAEEPTEVGALSPRAIKWIRIFSFILVAITLFMAVRMFQHGYFTMGGIDRFDFRSSDNWTSIDERYYTWIVWLLPIPLIAGLYGYSGITLVFSAAYIAYLLLVGDKFTSLFQFANFFMWVCVLARGITKKTANKILICLVGLFCILFCYIAIQVSFESGFSVEGITEYFDNRLTGGQSDLWWTIFGGNPTGEMHIDELSDELGAIISQPSNPLEYNFGIYKMMRIAAPSSVVNYYLSHGSRFTASGQASLFYYFGYPGLFVGAIIVGAVYVLAINQALVAYKRQDIVQSICYSVIITKLNLLFTMSDVTVFGQSTFILAAAIIFITNYFRRKMGTLASNSTRGVSI